MGWDHGLCSQLMQPVHGETQTGDVTSRHADRSCIPSRQSLGSQWVEIVTGAESTVEARHFLVGALPLGR
jgi:hypothetical protein